MFSSIPIIGALLVALATSTPLLHERATSISPVLNDDFPDPSIFHDTDGTYYAFATNNGGINVQVASASSPSGPWTLLPNDLLPTVGAWSTGTAVWAPDVRLIAGKYVLYYSATVTSDTSKHCVGTATSDTVLGPYTPANTAIACPLSQGGAIDASGFVDTDGSHYLVYKVDGNSIGHGGSCGNTVAPIVPTPLMLLPLSSTGTTNTSAPIELLDRDQYDGPLIEAPNLILVNGVYILFFSSNCYTTTLYDVSYATATSLKGPYTKSSAPLMVTDSPFEITAPGGAQATVNGKSLVFHANCAAGRCLFERAITVVGTTVSIS